VRPPALPWSPPFPLLPLHGLPPAEAHGSPGGTLALFPPSPAVPPLPLPLSVLPLPLPGGGGGGGGGAGGGAAGGGAGGGGGGGGGVTPPAFPWSPPFPLFPLHGLPPPDAHGSPGGTLALSPPLPAVPPLPLPLSVFPFPPPSAGGGVAGDAAGGGGDGGGAGGPLSGDPPLELPFVCGGGGGGGALPFPALPFPCGGGGALAGGPLPCPVPPLALDGGGGGGGGGAGLGLPSACAGAAPTGGFDSVEAGATGAGAGVEALRTTAPFSTRARSTAAAEWPPTSSPSSSAPCGVDDGPGGSWPAPRTLLGVTRPVPAPAAGTST